MHLSNKYNVSFKKIDCFSKIVIGGDKPTNSSKFKDNLHKFPIISNGINKRSLYGYTTNFKIDKPCVTISARGTIGYPTFRNYPFYPIVRLIVIIPNEQICLAKFLSYFLNTQTFNINRTGIYQLTSKDINNLLIPIPPLEIQNEIVRILDKYTELEKELEKELELRTKQYEYYRDRLFLNLYKKKLIFKSINEVCNFNKKSKLGVKNIEKLDEKGEIPFFTSGNRILYVNNFLVQDENIFMNDGGAADFKFYKGNANYSDHIISFKSKDKKVILNKFLFYFLLYKKDYINDTFFVGAGLKNISKKRFSDYEIPVPSIDIQKRIINILDRFLNIIKDLEQGIPKQIELTHKEYLYYRNKLLNFEEKNK